MRSQGRLVELMMQVLQYGQHNVVVMSSREELSAAVADFISQQIARSLQRANNYYLALSGGSTPADLYSCLARDYMTQIDWAKMQIYFGDERFVAHDHDDSNYRMACETLLSKVAIPAENVHAMPTDCPHIDDCVQRYVQDLADIPTSDGLPMFDLILLGMGDDGHTASLFPGTAILDEKDSSVGSVYVEKFNSWRISLTYPVLNMAKQLLVLVAGTSKATVLRDIMHGDNEDYPIARINNSNGMLWFVDNDAASELTG